MLLETINGFNIWKRNIPYILLRYLLYCSDLMEFLSYSILVIFQIIVSRNIATIPPQDTRTKAGGATHWYDDLTNCWRLSCGISIFTQCNCLPCYKIHIPAIHFLGILFYSEICLFLIYQYVDMDEILISSASLRWSYWIWNTWKWEFWKCPLGFALWSGGESILATSSYLNLQLYLTWSTAGRVTYVRRSDSPCCSGVTMYRLFLSVYSCDVNM